MLQTREFFVTKFVDRGAIYKTKITSFLQVSKVHQLVQVLLQA